MSVRTGTTTPCEWCSAPVYRMPSQLRARVFCSRECSNRSHSRVMQERKELRAGGGVQLSCLYCGDTFYVKANRAESRKFCSRACFADARYGTTGHRSNRDRSGPANPNYRGTNNPITARKIALKLYSPRCMICGWDIAVDVHHIIPRRHGGTNDPENLIILCPNHHRMADLAMIATDELQTALENGIPLTARSLPS